MIQWQIFTNFFATFMEVLRSKEAPVAAGRKEWRLPKRENHSSLICVAQAVLSPTVNSEMLQRADSIFSEGRCITFRHLVLSLSVSKRSVSHSFLDLEYSKVCERYVLRNLKIERNRGRKQTSSELLVRFGTERETALYPGVTTDKRWALPFEMETKCIPWNDTILNLHGKQSESSRAGKVMITVF
jgi:hypothetical protein